MTILSWPAGLRNPSSISGPALTANTQSGGRSPFDSTEQTLELPGARWVAELRWDNLPPTQWRILTAFIASLRGQSGRFAWGPSGFVPRLATGAANPGETIRVRTASQTGATLDTTGWDGLAAPAKAGDFIGYLSAAGRPQLLMVTADVAPVEPSSTNLALYSASIAVGTGYIIGGSTTDGGAATDPNGTTGALRISSTSGGSNAYISHTPRITVIGGGTYTFSTFIRLHSGALSGRCLTVDEWNGTTTTRTDGLTIVSVDPGGAWGRLSRTFTLLPDTIGVTVYYVDNFTLAAATVYDVWGFQVEPRGSVTNLIATTSAPATRTQSVVIPISPPIRRSPNINEPLILAAPTGVWKLGQDMVAPDYTQRGQPVASITMPIEDLLETAAATALAAVQAKLDTIDTGATRVELPGDIGAASAADLTAEAVARAAGDAAILAAAAAAAPGLAPVQSVAGRTGAVALTVADVSGAAAAASVTAEASARSDADALLAPLASPPLTGNPTAPTQTAGNNTTRLATTAFVTTAVAGKANAADAALTGTPAIRASANGTADGVVLLGRADNVDRTSAIKYKNGTTTPGQNTVRIAVHDGTLTGGVGGLVDVLELRGDKQALLYGGLSLPNHVPTLSADASTKSYVDGLTKALPPGATATRTADELITEEINVKSFGAKADCITRLAAVTITSGSTGLTVAGAAFAAADVGKIIQIDGAGVAGAALRTTITGYTSATQVTLATAASTALAAVAKAVSYGTDNTAAFNAAWQYIRNGGRTDGLFNYTIRHIVVPIGEYLVVGSINWTNCQLMGLHIIGQRATIRSVAAGKVAIDMLGTRYATVMGLTVIGDAGAVPLCGLLLSWLGCS
jgi:hypothetical protein